MVTRPLCQATVIHQTPPSPLVIISQSMHNQNFKYYVGTPSLLRPSLLRPSISETFSFQMQPWARSALPLIDFPIEGDVGATMTLEIVAQREVNP